MRGKISVPPKRKVSKGYHPGRARTAWGDTITEYCILVVVRGPAGSGKTTLLSWIVTQCAKIQEESVSKTGWEGLIPFFVPLRKVARIETGAPSVRRLIDYSVDEKVWTRSPPSAWLDRVLRGQRAVIMIDGVDELPASRRAGFWAWLQALIAEFPGNRVIVTSRALPGSPLDGQTTDQWNPPSSMIEAQLQDMSNADVTKFIHHWHDAVDSSKLDQSEKNSLMDARQKLPQKLEDPANRRIRELCNTPLLCAMVCVLHWREEGYLPRYRVDLYDKCCDMLIEARDLKREILPPPGPLAAMSKNDKEMVLQRLAIEMMHNRQDGDSGAEETYRIEISRDKAIRWISPKIAGFQSTLAREAQASEVLDFLVERTGLLREPAKDLIDFPHRTFQEYLAACAAGADSQEDMLAKKADDDQWHETIMLAAGTTTGGVGFGRNLIEALLDRGERHKSARKRQQNIRKTCFALALGCLENLKQHDTNLRDRVLSNLGELVPPRNEVDAGILSVAGDAAVAHLAYNSFKDENTVTVAACARALRLIGTTEAMKALERGYINDQREPVIAEVCRTDQFEYINIPVVATFVAKNGRLPHFAPSENLQLCVGLDGLKQLSIDWSDARNTAYIANATQLEILSIDRVDDDYKDLANINSNLETLSIARPLTGSFPWVGRLEKLRSFSASGRMEGLDLSVLSTLPALNSVTLSMVAFSSVEAISGVATLEKLTLNGIFGDRNVDFLTSLTALRNLTIEDTEVTDFTALGKLRSLQDLRIMGAEDVRKSPKFFESSPVKNLYYSNISGAISVSDFSSASGLEKLGLVSCRNLNEFGHLKNLTGLRSLQLGNLQIDAHVEFGSLTRLETLRLGMLPQLKTEWLNGLSSQLTNLVIQRCPNLSDLNFLANCDQISILSLAGLQGVSDMSPLRDLNKITTLTLENCDNIQSLSWISNLPIEELSLASMDGVKDFSPIADLSSLKTIALFDCDHLDDLTFLADLPSLEKIWVFTQQDKLHIPEAVAPKVVRGPPYGSQWRTFRNDWPDDIWMYEEMHDHMYRRVHRPSYYYWHQRQLRLADSRVVIAT
ncbi:NACHT domain-containing protein [Rhizobium leguminosarum]|nr:NACHT domain-containing protein [Rhizobium leguminosarum]